MTMSLLPNQHRLRIGDHVIAWSEWGEGPPILVEHALTGGPDVHAWWPGVVGPGRPLDTRTHRVLCPNLVGSCYGTEGPPLDPAAQADLQAQWLSALQVPELALVVGGSLGGMIALQLAARHPARVQRVAALATTLAARPWVQALNHVQRLALDRGDLPLARAIAMLTYRTPQDLDQRPHPADWLDHHGARLAARFTPEAYRALTLVMDAHQLHPAHLNRFPGPLLSVGIRSDLLFLPQEAHAIAAAAPRGRYVELDVAEGHDAFLLHLEPIGALLRALLQETP